jgi:tetrahydromethanopterin S-methyltransferase subunit F
LINRNAFDTKDEATRIGRKNRIAVGLVAAVFFGIVAVLGITVSVVLYLLSQFNGLPG